MSVEKAAPWTRDRKDDAIEAEATVVEGEVTREVSSAVEPVNVDSALAINNNEDREIAATSRTYSAQPDFKAKDLMIPKLRLAQGQTPEVLAREAQPGQWVLFGNEASDEVEVVFLAAGFARELRLRQQGSPDDRKILCRSADGEVGVGEPGGYCERCPLSMWTDRPGQKGKPPECSEIYTYQVYVLTHNALAILEFQRTGTDSAKLINTMMKVRGMQGFKVKLGSERRQNGNQIFFAPKITPRPITEEEAAIASMFIPA